MKRRIIIERGEERPRWARRMLGPGRGFSNELRILFRVRMDELEHGDAFLVAGLRSWPRRRGADSIRVEVVDRDLLVTAWAERQGAAPIAATGLPPRWPGDVDYGVLLSIEPGAPWDPAGDASWSPWIFAYIRRTRHETVFGAGTDRHRGPRTYHVPAGGTFSWLHGPVTAERLSGMSRLELELFTR